METSKLADSTLFVYSPFQASNDICITLPDNTINPMKRSDNKLIFKIDEDGYLNGKYKWLESKYPITQKIWKCNGVFNLNNDKNLEKGLERILLRYHLWEEEIRILTTMWKSKLQVVDVPYFKCEIFLNERINAFFPLSVDRDEYYSNRILIKFIPTEKKVKDTFEKEPFLGRTNNIRLIEMCGYIEEAK